MDVNERLRGYKRVDYSGQDCILIPVEDPLARRIKEEKLAAYSWNPNGFLIVVRDQLIKALESGQPWKWESPEQKRRRLGHYERTREEIRREMDGLKGSIRDAQRDLKTEEARSEERGESYDEMAVGEWGRLMDFIRQSEMELDDLNREEDELISKKSPKFTIRRNTRRGRMRKYESKAEGIEFDRDARIKMNARRSKQLRDFQGRGRKKEVYRTCKKCGVTEDPNEVQLFYCQSCGQSFDSYVKLEIEQFFRKFEPEWWQHKIVRSALIGETSKLYNVVLDMWSRHDLSEEDSHWLMETGDDAIALLRQALDALTGPGEPTRYLTNFMRLPLPPALKGLRPFEDLYQNTYALVERAKMGEDAKHSLALFEFDGIPYLFESSGGTKDFTLENLLRSAQTNISNETTKRMK